MTIKSSSDTRSSSTTSTRRAEAPPPPPKPQPTPVGAKTNKQASEVASGFSDSKVAEMREIAGGLLAPKEKEPAIKASSGFDMPEATADSIKGSSTAEASGKAKLGAVTLGISAKATGSVSLGTADGMTTLKVSAEVSGTLSGETKLGSVGVKGSTGKGVSASYTVSMPEEAAKTLDPSTLDPLDPSTMPVGSTVKLDSSEFEKTELGASFKALSLGSSVKEGEGTSLTIEKTGETTVRVSTGPTKTIDATTRLAVGIGQVSAGIGRTDDIDGGTVRSAEFDLATPEGAKAYEAFLKKGTLPEAAGPGVSGVTTKSYTSMTSTSKVDVRAGDERLSADLSSNAGVYTRTTLPDGTTTGTADLRFGEGAALHVDQTFKPDGTEDFNQRTYSYSIKADNELEAAQLSAALGKEVTVGQTVEMKLTEAQMTELRELSGATLSGDTPSLDPEQFAINLAKKRGPGELEGYLFTVSDLAGAGRGEFKAIPSEVIIRP